MRYATAEAFRAALEDRLKNAENETVGISRLRKRVVFERLLARLTVQAAGEWVLKGGFALELRLDELSRSTRGPRLHTHLRGRPAQLTRQGSHRHRRHRRHDTDRLRPTTRSTRCPLRRASHPRHSHGAATATPELGRHLVKARGEPPGPTHARSRTPSSGSVPRPSPRSHDHTPSMGTRDRLATVLESFADVDSLLPRAVDAALARRAFQLGDERDQGLELTSNLIQLPYSDAEEDRIAAP
jgi:hypothetical protein